MTWRILLCALSAEKKVKKQARAMKNNNSKDARNGKTKKTKKNTHKQVVRMLLGSFCFDFWFFGFLVFVFLLVLG